MSSSSGTIIVSAGLLVENDLVLLSQRKKGAHLENAWEFPGGKVESGEDPESALIREFKEELGIDIAVDAIFHVTFHRYPMPTPELETKEPDSKQPHASLGKTKDILLLFYLVHRRDLTQTVLALDVQNVTWSLLSTLDPSIFPAADHDVVLKLRASNL